MKSIEECLDIILIELVKNWDKEGEQRDDLKAGELLTQLGLPQNMEKHEFFKRLIWRLINDGYAEVLPGKTLSPGSNLFVYENVVLITIEGYYFITDQKGYTQREKGRQSNLQDIRDRYEKTERNEGQLVMWTQNLTNKTAALTFWTRLVAIGALALVLWDVIKTFWIERACH